jgi:DNA-binding transcriptional LysR family regulator
MLMDMWERDLEIRHLVALRAVAAERSFGRAGERLGFTQSAISQQIAALERVVGAPVFDRPGGPRPVELTPVGRVVLAHAESILHQLTLAEDEVGQLRSGDGGRLVVGTFQSVTVKVVPSVIRVLKAERPELDIRLFEADELSVLVDRLLDGQLDLAFMVDIGPDERLERTHLLDDPYVLISPRAAPTARSTVTVGSLADAPLIGEYDSSCQAGIDRGLRAAGVEPTYVFRSNDNSAVQAMVRVGMGQAVLPALSVESSDPDVVIQDLDPPIPPRTISLVRRVGRTLPPAADRFTEIAVAVCAGLSTVAGSQPMAS